MPTRSPAHDLVTISVLVCVVVYYAAIAARENDPQENNSEEKSVDVVRRITNPYTDLIDSSANSAGVEPAILERLLYRESRFRPEIIDGTVKSRVGALGIAQFMPATAREWCGSVDGALNPESAIPAAARYLAWLQKQFDGDIISAVASYNWGVGNVKRKGLANCPAETQKYVLEICGVDVKV